MAIQCTCLCQDTYRILSLIEPVVYHLVAYSNCRLQKKQYTCALQTAPMDAVAAMTTRWLDTNWWVWHNYTHHFRYERSSNKWGFRYCKQGLEKRSLNKQGSTVLCQEVLWFGLLVWRVSFLADTVVKISMLWLGELIFFFMVYTISFSQYSCALHSYMYFCHHFWLGIFPTLY